MMDGAQFAASSTGKAFKCITAKNVPSNSGCISDIEQARAFKIWVKLRNRVGGSSLEE